MPDQRTTISERFAFIGFGEAAQAFLEGWRTVADIEVAAFDIKTDVEATRATKLADYDRFNVARAETALEAVKGADVVISAVTAEAAPDAARSAIPALGPGQLYLDINSCAPSKKRASEDMISTTGADYLDMAVMAPVYPARHHTPILIAGAGAKKVEGLLQRLEMKFDIVSDRVGDASTIKMVRSVMIKGIEALVSESIVAAVREGIDDKILASLEDAFPGMDWKKRSGYMLERMVRHGRRRAEEMREVAKTMDDLGIGGLMAAATAERQQLVADLNLLDDFDGQPPEDHRVLAEAILKARAAKETP